MRHNAQVVSFPIDASTRPLLRDFMGTDRQRLDEIVVRLDGLASMLFCLKNSDQLEGGPAQSVMMSLEQMVRDCIAVAELRPVLAG